MITNLKTIIATLEETLVYLKKLDADEELKNILKHTNTKHTKHTNQIITEKNNLSDTEQEIISNHSDQNIDEEKWSDIEMYGINFNYQISSYGRVKNKADNYILSQNLRDGYKSVCLCYKDENNQRLDKSIKVHRLVAFGFVQNDDPINKKIVNHIDGNRLNNHWKNFEWTTTGGNNQHAITNNLIKITKRRVTQLDMEDNEIETFESLDAASKSTGINDGSIVKVCKGSRNSAGGFKWEYADVNPNEQTLTDEDLESFVKIKDFPNYLIDRAGRVYSKPYRKFLKTTKTRDQSQELQLANNGIRKTVLLHNLMADTFLEKVNGKNEVGHINRNKSDNRLVNLKRVNHAELCAMASEYRNNQQQNNQQQNQIGVLDV